MESSGDLPSLRSASSAKSIIMMAFFLTMPISRMMPMSATTPNSVRQSRRARMAPTPAEGSVERRSEEHTSELQSRLHLVCRLLLEKKKKKNRKYQLKGQKRDV